MRRPTTLFRDLSIRSTPPAGTTILTSARAKGAPLAKSSTHFMFDAQTIEVDRASIYTMNDPDNLFQRPPMVASFRIRGPPDKAFTFTLIDIHTEPDEAESEIDALARVYPGGDRRARRRRRHPDGRPQWRRKEVRSPKATAEHHLGHLGRPTNTRHTKTYDNLIFNRAATVEFTGRAGVFDILRRTQSHRQQALEVSDHFPVWAEFSVYEGGQPGRVANRQESLPQR